MKAHLLNLFTSGFSARDNSPWGVPNTRIKKSKLSFDFSVYGNIRNSDNGFTN